MADANFTPEEKISKVLENGFSKIENLFAHENSDVFTIDICRAIDFHAIRELSALEEKEEDKHSQDFDYMKRGFPILLKSFYKSHNPRSGFPLQSSMPETDALADVTLIVAGKHSIAEQLVKQSQAQLLQFTEIAENEFAFKYITPNSGVEYIDNIHIASHFGKVKRSIAPEFKKHLKKQPGIRQEMKELVFPDRKFFLKYDTTSQIDRFFSKMGRYQLVTTQICDVFDDKSIFGGIEYLKYIRVLQELIGMAFKHTEYCTCLIEKDPNTNFRNVICIPRIIEETIPDYAEYLGLKEWEVKQIFECLTVDADNIHHHIRDQKSFSPIFIRISKTHVMQSVFGSLNNPMLFLLRELARRYKRDYDNNTDREERFRNEFYTLISENSAFRNKLITVGREVVISVPGVKTDIDAIVFDRKARNLALVQLKWQMLFAHDLKERRNRLSEYRKAEEWVNKMKVWTSTRSSREILSALTILDKLPNKSMQLNKVFLFVVNRYNSSFTGFFPNTDAVWTSWYVIENILENLDSKLKNPIEDLDRMLRSLALHEINMHDSLDVFEMEVEGLKFVYSKKDEIDELQNDSSRQI